MRYAGKMIRKKGKTRVIGRAQPRVGGRDLYGTPRVTGRTHLDPNYSMTMSDTMRRPPADTVVQCRQGSSRGQSRHKFATSTRRASIDARGRGEPSPAQRRVPRHQRGDCRRRQRVVAVCESTVVRRSGGRGGVEGVAERRPSASRRRRELRPLTGRLAVSGQQHDPSTRPCAQIPATRRKVTIGVSFVQGLLRSESTRYKCAAKDDN